MCNVLLWWGGELMIEFLICRWGGARCANPAVRANKFID